MHRRIVAIYRYRALKTPSSVFRRVATDANMLSSIFWQIVDTKGVPLQHSTFQS